MLTTTVVSPAEATGGVEIGGIATGGWAAGGVGEAATLGPLRGAGAAVDELTTTACWGAGAGTTTAGCDESLEVNSMTPSSAPAPMPHASPVATITRLALRSSARAVTGSVGPAVAKPLRTSPSG